MNDKNPQEPMSEYSLLAAAEWLSRSGLFTIDESDAIVRESRALIKADEDALRSVFSDQLDLRTALDDDNEHRDDLDALLKAAAIALAVGIALG